MTAVENSRSVVAFAVGGVVQLVANLLKRIIARDNRRRTFAVVAGVDYRTKRRAGKFRRLFHAEVVKHEQVGVDSLRDNLRLGELAAVAERVANIGEQTRHLDERDALSGVDEFQRDERGEKRFARAAVAIQERAFSCLQSGFGVGDGVGVVAVDNVVGEGLADVLFGNMCAVEPSGDSLLTVDLASRGALSVADNQRAVLDAD